MEGKERGCSSRFQRVGGEVCKSALPGSSRAWKLLLAWDPAGEPGLKVNFCLLGICFHLNRRTKNTPSHLSSFPETAKHLALGTTDPENECFTKCVSDSVEPPPESALLKGGFHHVQEWPVRSSSARHPRRGGESSQERCSHASQVCLHKVQNIGSGLFP